MPKFMFNLLFDFSKDAGLFEDPPTVPDTDNPLKNSKHWLKSKPEAGSTPDPENQEHWDDLDAGTLHIPRNNTQRAEMAIRIAPKAALDAGAMAEVVAAFGRPAIQSPRRQPFASPFLDSANRAITMFYEKPERPKAGTTGWTIQLGKLTRDAPSQENRTHRYEFAVGIRVKLVNDIRSFGEDPEFDVGG